MFTKTLHYVNPKVTFKPLTSKDIPSYGFLKFNPFKLYQSFCTDSSDFYHIHTYTHTLVRTYTHMHTPTPDLCYLIVIIPRVFSHFSLCILWCCFSIKHINFQSSTHFPATLSPSSPLLLWPRAFWGLWFSPARGLMFSVTCPQGPSLLKSKKQTFRHSNVWQMIAWSLLKFFSSTRNKAMLLVILLSIIC
jgi:hypothetical protein